MVAVAVDVSGRDCAGHHHAVVQRTALQEENAHEGFLP